MAGRYRIVEEYLSQRRGLNSNKVKIILDEDIDSEISYLLQVLSNGDQIVYDDSVNDLFNELSQDEQQNNAIVEASDALRGVSITHLTIKNKNEFYNDQFISLLNFIKLCPNLVSLHFNLIKIRNLQVSSLVDMTLKLTNLDKLQFLILKINYKGFTLESFKEFSDNLSKISNLLDLTISFLEVQQPFWKHFYQSLANLKRINRLYVQTYYFEEKVDLVKDFDKILSRICTRKMLRLVKQSASVSFHLSYRFDRMLMSRSLLKKQSSEDENTDNFGGLFS